MSTFKHVLDGVGGTPVLELALGDCPRVAVRAHLEFYNPTGSVKDRAASFILERLIAQGRLKPGGRVIESSSGNFGISLAAYCRRHGLKFTCVIDPRINPTNEWILRSYDPEVVKVTEPDGSGGFLKTRIQTVEKMVEEEPSLYWVNQYGNRLNAEAYYTTLGEEMSAVPRLDYVFLGVSSGGTITGVSRKVRERHPDVRVIAVDSVGSVIFGGAPRARAIPGIGSSIRPKILDDAKIDDVVLVDEVTAVRTCRELHKVHGVFAGGSTGSVVAGIRRFFRANPADRDVVVATAFADRGDRYIDTIHNPMWYAKFIAASTAPPPV